MNEQFYLKKIEESIETTIRKKSSGFNLELLINYIISKLNSTSHSEEGYIESILLKLIQSGFSNIVKIYCYYLISNFNHEFSPSFFTAITSELNTDILNFEKFDLNLNAMRNYINLGEKEISDNYSFLEQFFKSPKFDINILINSFYYSNFPITLLDVLDKFNIEDYRSHKEFLKKFYLELAKIIFTIKLEDGAFINLIQIIDKIIIRFTCFKNLSTKDKVINSIIVFIAEYLIINLEEILDLITTFDIKLIMDIVNFPVNLYKIFIFYKDPNKKNNKYEKIFHRYIQYVFKNIKGIVDPELFTQINKAITEFRIIDDNENSIYSTEIIEFISKFMDFCDNFEKNSWFDFNIKLISKLIDEVDYEEAIDIIIILLSYTKYIGNSSDRIYTIFNLFYKLIIMNINYYTYFDKESLILCLFKQDWFVFLINKDNCDDKESRFRHDLFICLIEALFYTKIYILKNGYLKKFIYLIKICLDIIDVCFKIIEWSDEGEAYKMYFLVLEETCLFFDDPFFCFLYGQETEFTSMKTRLEQVLLEIGKRFSNKVWSQLSFANENSKYRSLLLLSQFLNIDNTNSINTILEVIFLRMNEIPLDKQNEKFVEQIIRSCLFLGVRVNLNSREKIINNLTDFVEKVKIKYDADLSILTNIRSFAENILNYLLNHKYDPQIILDSKIVDKLNNEFFLIIPKEVESNIIQKNINFNNLYLLNICENSNLIVDSVETSSLYVEYFKKLYFPVIEFNDAFSHMLIDNKYTFKFSDWKLVTGISDPIHIYYMYKIDIETREIELFVKNFNSTSCVLNNVTFNIYLSKNLVLKIGTNLSQYYTRYVNNKEFHLELLSPFSTYEFNLKFASTIFEKNNITIECIFDMATDNNNGQVTLTSDSFYIPLIDFCVPDNFSLFETKMFDIFYTTLEYTFTCKCYAVCTPEDLIKHISDRFIMIEFKSKNNSIYKSKSIMDKLKENNYKGFFSRNSIKENDFINSEENQRYNFKIKMSSYCIYNFWIYIVILGDYNFSNNKSILNIEIKSNDLTALSIISKERSIFFNELLNKQIKFY